MQTKREHHYFAAMNSADGFCDYFLDVFSGLSHLYIIKGGSGTGKSHLMRQIAQAALTRGLAVDYYHCSSDPSSLDGILLPALSIGVLDGTAPHTHDPVYPGVTDEIINVGDFWDMDALYAKRARITALIDQKQKSYDQLYRYLGGARLLRDTVREMTLPSVRTEKMRAAVARLLRPFGPGAAGTAVMRITEAFGMDGPFAFDTLEAGVDALYTVRDRFDCADLFLEELRAQALARGLSVVYSPDILCPTRLRTVLIENTLCVTAVEDIRLPQRTGVTRVINMERFVDTELLQPLRAKLRFCRRCYDAFLEQAQVIFSEIKALHFTLEQCYIPCMDFARKEAFTDQLIARIFPD